MKDFICSRCVYDLALADYVREIASSVSCTFCNLKDSQPIAAETIKIIERVRESIESEYEDPVQSVG